MDDFFKKRKQEQEDFRLAKELADKEQEAAKPLTEEQIKEREEQLKKDEELARSLSDSDGESEEPAAPPPTRMHSLNELIPPGNTAREATLPPIPDTNADEELARRLQEEEEEAAAAEVEQERNQEIRRQQAQANEGPFAFPFPYPSIIPRATMPARRGLTDEQRSLMAMMSLMGLGSNQPVMFSNAPNARPGLVGNMRSVPFPLVFPGYSAQDERVATLPPHLQRVVRGDGPADYESLLALEELLHPVNRGATQETLQVLPTHKYHASATLSNDESKTKCGICLADYEEGEELKTLTCLHSFHSGCVDKWLAINKVCPVCRKEIDVGNAQ
eukprot:TRINITY_DN6197_c0_g1_i2.p1 TRINITY_DN6197_c0_g1~~TRINITY_DN6197_c0_g1_i2.p1  ORF type:complete len:331 (-),score=46.72 TRINITY_DN6197_c0_g1_i2:21-1013(-)